jgi:DNA-binding IclR family transcriptional regulator
MIQVLHRALDILEYCAKNPEQTLSLSEIADKFELNHGTCANILKTLVLRNYIEQVGHKKGYRLGAMAYQLTGNFSFRRDLVQVAKGPMQELTDEMNETCLIAVLRKTDLKRVVLHQVLSSHDLTVRTSIEKEAYAASTGRFLLAFIPEKEIEALVAKFGLPRPGIWPEVNSMDQLLKELKTIRDNGVSIQYDQNHIVGLAVPVLKEGQVIASLSVYLPEVRYKGDMKERLLSSLKFTAQQINSNIDALFSKV